MTTLSKIKAGTMFKFHEDTNKDVYMKGTTEISNCFNNNQDILIINLLDGKIKYEDCNQPIVKLHEPFNKKI